MAKNSSSMCSWQNKTVYKLFSRTCLEDTIRSIPYIRCWALNCVVPKSTQPLSFSKGIKSSVADGNPEWRGITNQELNTLFCTLSVVIEKTSSPKRFYDRKVKYKKTSISRLTEIWLDPSSKEVERNVKQEVQNSRWISKCTSGVSRVSFKFLTPGLHDVYRLPKTKQTKKGYTNGVTNFQGCVTISITCFFLMDRLSKLTWSFLNWSPPNAARQGLMFPHAIAMANKDIKGPTLRDGLHEKAWKPICK